MQRHWFGLLLVALLGLAGCNRGGNLESVPESPPPDKAPTLPVDVALRPYYHFAGKAPISAGTGFVVEDKAKKLYFLTAAHVMDDEAEWKSIQEVSLRVMGGDFVAEFQNRPLYLGKAFDAADASVDLVVWSLPEGSALHALKLAAADPKKNEWVWAVGQEPGSSGPQKTFRCKVTGAERGGLLLQQHDRFEMRGFSGGPIVNDKGEVVGSLLGGRGQSIISSKVSTIRARLAEAKVEVP